MPNATATQVKKSNNPFDIFITGLRKGFNVAINNLMPNVLMAFVLAYILDLFGVMAFLGKVCGPVMSIFDLPGQAITVLCATWLSCGAGVGVAASLLASGTLNAHDITILSSGPPPDGFPRFSTWADFSVLPTFLKNTGRCLC